MMTLLFGIKDVIWRSFCFQNNDTITLRQAFISMDLHFVQIRLQITDCNFVTENI